MKTTRNQMKYPKDLRLPLFLENGIKICPYSIFNAAKKNKKKTTNKNSIKTCQKTLSKPYGQNLALKVCSIAPSSDINNVL